MKLVSVILQTLMLLPCLVIENFVLAWLELLKLVNSTCSCFDVSLCFSLFLPFGV